MTLKTTECQQYFEDRKEDLAKVRYSLWSIILDFDYKLIDEVLPDSFHQKYNELQKQLASNLITSDEYILKWLRLGDDYPLNEPLLNSKVNTFAELIIDWLLKEIDFALNLEYPKDNSEKTR